jgi:glycerol-3-phosphate dehydrogenase (NAD(P)+)
VPRVAVVGTTTWSTTLAIHLSRKGVETTLLARTSNEAAGLEKERENSRYLPGRRFPDHLKVGCEVDKALDRVDMAVVAVPSQRMRENLRWIRPHLPADSIVLSAAKGLDMDTGKRMSQLLEEELALTHRDKICVLSGPNLAMEIVAGKPSSTVIASNNEEAASEAQLMLMSPLFRVYTNDDVVGVEMGGALKNIIALGCGISDGLGYGDNAKAAFMTRGLAEITRLGVAAGANPLTFAGLAGLGDLVATCSSGLSRNRYVGMELAKGRPLKDILKGMKNVAEGVYTTSAALKMGRELEVELPIAEATSRVLFEGLPVGQAIVELMGRPPRAE